MMNKILFMLAFNITSIFTFAQSEAKLVKAFGNRFAMSIPEGMDTMSAEHIKLKYNKIPDGKSYYYSNDGVDFSMVIATVTDGIKEEDMVKHKDDLTNPLVKKGYVLEENIVKKINNHNLIIVSFYSDVPDGKIFNRRFFAVVGGKLILVTFNTTEKELEKRRSLIEKSINSVIIK